MKKSKKSAIMIQGTSSGAGKSLLTAAFCRHFKNAGYRVAPFKSQNMALNSFVTVEGEELAFAQAFQAFAAGIAPTCDMNPLLLKPKGKNTSQVILRGKPVGDMSASDYHQKFREEAITAIDQSIDAVQEQFDVIVLEGAGSPAEMNLKKNDLSNMFMAKKLGAPVIIVSDIDRGGSIASIYGTYDLLDQEEKDLVVGFIINKFRGDISLFEPAKEIILKLTGKPVLGVIPMLEGVDLPEEDSQFGLESFHLGSGIAINVRTVRLPHISNFSDLDPFKISPLYDHKFVNSVEELRDADIVILPGTKSTASDLRWCTERGILDEVKRLADDGVVVVGICGGLQMLGRELSDPDRVDGDGGTLEGFGLLPVRTTFHEHKKTIEEEYIVVGGAPLGLLPGDVVRGFEIRHGVTAAMEDGVEFLMGLDGFGDGEDAGNIGTTLLFADNLMAQAGFSNERGNVVGTYLHGFFDNEAVFEGLTRLAFERKLSLTLSKQSDLDGPTDNHLFAGFNKYDRSLVELEKVLVREVDMNYIYEKMGL